MQEKVCQQPSSERKERWAVSAKNKFKIIESVSSISLCQDGRPQTSKGSTKQGELNGEVRPTGYVFQCSTPQGKQEICIIPVGGESF